MMYNPDPGGDCYWAGNTSYPWIQIHLFEHCGSGGGQPILTEGGSIEIQAEQSSESMGHLFLGFIFCWCVEVDRDCSDIAKSGTILTFTAFSHISQK